MYKSQSMKGRVLTNYIVKCTKHLNLHNFFMSDKHRRNISYYKCWIWNDSKTK